MPRERNTFLTPLVTESLPDGKRFKLHHEFTYRWRGYPGNIPLLITVTAGFVTDLASIPRVARLIIPKLGRWNKAAVIHDYLYTHLAVNVNGGDVVVLSRKVADDIFLDGMTDLGVEPWKRRLMWLAVRIFGGFAWRKR